MPTKNFIYLFICFFIFISCKVGQPTYCRCDKCECEAIRQEDQYIDGAKVTQVFAYIPKKAGAKIVQQIKMGKESFVGYQNHRFYSVFLDRDSDRIRFFNIENNKIIIEKEIIVSKTIFLSDYTYKATRSVNIINDTIVLLAEVTNQNTNETFSSLLTFNENSNTLSFYDHSSDFDKLEKMTTFFFDTSKNKAYLSDNNGWNMWDKNKELVVNVYHYDKSAEKWIRDKSFYYDIKSKDTFLTKQYTIISHYSPYPWGSKGNHLLVYQNHNPHTYKKLNLTFLNLRFKIESAFSDDDGNIWLYSSDDGLFKLKMLRNKAAKNEYNEYWSRCATGKNVHKNRRSVKQNLDEICSHCTGTLKRVSTLDDVVNNQEFRYNPAKAGAKIVKRIKMEKESYVSYQNHQFYAIFYDNDNDRISFFDIANDKAAFKKQIIIPKTTFLSDYTYKATCSVNIINGTIVLLAEVTNQNTNETFNSLLTFNENSNTLSFYDHCPDFENLAKMELFFYDTLEKKAYLSDKSKSLAVLKFKPDIYDYDKSAAKWNKDASHGNYIFINCPEYMSLSHRHTIGLYYDRWPNESRLSFLYIYHNHDPEDYKKLDLTFLGLKYPPLSAFSDDDGNIWLYVCENSKYELLKLKLLE